MFTYNHKPHMNNITHNNEEGSTCHKKPALWFPPQSLMLFLFAPFLRLYTTLWELIKHQNRFFGELKFISTTNLIHNQHLMAMINMMISAMFGDVSPTKIWPDICDRCLSDIGRLGSAISLGSALSFIFTVDVGYVRRWLTDTGQLGSALSSCRLSSTA